jgi:CHAD domain-containing protein
MAFALNPTRPIRRGLKRLVRKTLRRAGQDLRHDPKSAVHEVRKRVKQVRAIVKVLQQTDAGSLAKDARRLRAAGQRLSILRDADAVIATFDHLRTRFPTRLPEHTYAIMRRQLVRAKARIMRDARAEQSQAHVAHTLHAVCRSVKRWRVPAIEVLQWPALLKESYRASRTAMRRAQEETCPSELHRWRKRVKTLWYQLRVAELLAPGLRHEMRRFNQLQTWLGEDHDLYVMQETLADDGGLHQVPADVRTLAVMSSALQTALRRKSFTLGERLLADRPKAFARRMRHAFSPH